MLFFLPFCCFLCLVMLAQPQTQARCFSRLCATSAVPNDTFGLNGMAAVWKALPCLGSLQQQRSSSKGRWFARHPQWLLVDNRGLWRRSDAVLIPVPPVPCCWLSPCSEGEAGRSSVDAKEKDAASRRCSSTGRVVFAALQCITRAPCSGVGQGGRGAGTNAPCLIVSSKPSLSNLQLFAA